MVFDKHTNFAQYCNLHPLFNDVLSFVQSKNLNDLSSGRHEVGTNGVFLVVNRYTTKDLAQCFTEGHRKYIDIQFMLSGTEKIGYCNIKDCTQVSYEESKDLVILEGQHQYITFSPEEFVMFFPQDGHLTMALAGNSPDAVTKVVFKIPVMK